MQQNIFGLIAPLALGLRCAMAAAAAESDVATLQTPALELNISPASGAFEIHDKVGGVSWRSNPYQARFGEVTFSVDGRSRHADMGKCEIRNLTSGNAQEKKG